MVAASVLDGHVTVQVKGNVVAPNAPANFVVPGSPANVANYIRQGSDLIIEMKTGQTFTIQGFAQHGLINNIVLSAGGANTLVDISAAFTAAAVSNGILAPALITIEAISASTSVASLLGILGAAGAAGGVGLVALSVASQTPAEATPPAAPVLDHVSDDVGTKLGAISSGGLGDGDHTITYTLSDAEGNESQQSDPLEISVDGAPDAPVLSSVSDHVGSITGILQSGAVTNDTQPVFAGSGGEVGATIALKDNGSIIGTAIVAGDGSWSVSPTTALGEGDHSLTLVQTDADGHQSEPSAVFDISVDTSATSLTIDSVTDQLGSITGALIPGAVTNDTQPTLSGSGAEAGSRIELRDNGSLIGTAIAGSDGAWSVSPTTALSEGDHSLTVVQIDVAGNQSQPSAAFDVSVDTGAAGLTIDSVTDQLGSITGALSSGAVTNDTQPTLSGSGAEAGSTIELRDNGSVIGTAIAGSDGAWSVSPTTALTEGDHSLTVVQIDPAGNQSQPSAAFDISVDTSASQLVIGSVIDDVDQLTGPLSDGAVTNDTRPVLSGSGAEAGSTIELSDNGSVIGTAIAGSDGAWSVSPTAALADGSYSFTVVQIDPAGNRSQPSTAFGLTVDTQYSGADPVTEPTTTDQPEDRNPGIYVGTGLDPAPSLYVDGEKVASTYDPVSGLLTPVEPLGDGDHTITYTLLASGVLIALVIEFTIRMVRVELADYFGKDADQKLSLMFFARALDIRNDARPRSPGTLISQLRDLDQVREFFTSTAIGVMIDVPFIFAFLFIMWILGGPLVLVPIAAIPFIVIPGIVAQIPLAKLSREGLEEGAIRNAILMEAIYRAEDIKTLQAESRFRSVWERVNRTASEIGLRQRKLSASLVHFSQEIQQLAYVGVVVVGVYGILDGTMSYGSVLACSILTSRTIAPLGQIPAILGRLQNVRASKKGLNDLLKLPIDHDPDKDAYHRPNLAGRFQFENLAFAYDQESKPALTIPQLKINPGERIAILGRVGAGKSTFLRLIGGLATPSQGRILLDDTAMNLIDVSDVRRDVGFVLQESGLFYGTIRENLLIANPHATDEQILEAMRLACADRLLLNQPHGLDLKLRENGMGLSGGQKQSLLLARVFLRGPNILLLDEPTASLDDMTEGAIIENLRGWIGSRSLIVATHRYQVLNLVDRIILVDGGRVVQDGPKAEILAMLSGQNNAQKQAAAASGKLKN